MKKAPVAIPSLTFSMVIFLLLCLISCLDKIDLEADTPPQENIVIQGRLVLNEQGSSVRVKVSRLFDFTAEGTKPIYGSNIMVLDEESNSITLRRLPKTEDFHHIFLDTDAIQIEMGGRYKIAVTIPDGRCYESDLDQLVPLPANSLVNGEIIQLPVENAVGEKVPGDFLSIFTNTDVRLGDGTDSYSKWEIENCGLIISVRGFPFQVIDGSKFAADFIERHHLFFVFLIELEAGDGYCYRIFQESITQSSFAYWGDVQEVSVRTGNLFEPPAGAVTGNIHRIDDPSEQVYGHFYTTQERSTILTN